MVQENNFPYAHCAISDALTNAEILALEVADLTSATLAGTSVTAGGQTITVADIPRDVRNLSYDSGYGELNRTSIADNAVKTVQGRKTFTLRLSMYGNDATDASNEVILDDPSGVRLFFIERASGATLCMIGSVITANQPVNEDGDFVVDLEIRNSARMAPKWTT